MDRRVSQRSRYGRSALCQRLGNKISVLNMKNQLSFFSLFLLFLSCSAPQTQTQELSDAGSFPNQNLASGSLRIVIVIIYNVGFTEEKPTYLFLRLILQPRKSQQNNVKSSHKTSWQTKNEQSSITTQTLRRKQRLCPDQIKIYRRIVAIANIQPMLVMFSTTTTTTRGQWWW